MLESPAALNPQAVHERKRTELMEKEHLRWERMAQEAAAEAARMEAVRATGIRGKQNKSSEHFNIINLNYHSTPEGHMLQYKVRGGWKRVGCTVNAVKLLHSFIKSATRPCAPMYIRYGRCCCGRMFCSC
jgi:hypothetical protein